MALRKSEHSLKPSKCSAQVKGGKGVLDRSDTEIGLVVLNAAEPIIRLGSCKRSAAELARDLPVFGGRVERFLHQFPEYAG